MNRLLTVFIIVLLWACARDREGRNTLQTGIWRAAITIQGQELPFNFDVSRRPDGNYEARIHNGSERLLLDEIRVNRDSVDIALHIFDANIVARIEGDSMTGLFVKNHEKDYRIPFAAARGHAFRFEKKKNSTPLPDFSGKYDVVFVDNQDTTLAVGIFQQAGDSVTGTFLTPTGDYRYLQGNIAGDVMQLSTFDGNHAYLFKARKNSDGSLSGDYYSGKAHHETWTAMRNDNAVLPDAESLTYLKPGYERLDFTFPDVNGKKVSLTDEKYRNKVVVVQLFGTWCPNCMDETKFLSPWYDRNRHRGVEVIGLAYERKDDFAYASARVKKMIQKLGVNYEFVIAGTNDKEKASATLPMLNRVVAFPTTIFVGRDGKVKKIHTGFSGPGTGEYYDRFIEEFNETVNELLNEKIASSD